MYIYDISSLRVNVVGWKYAPISDIILAKIKLTISRSEFRTAFKTSRQYSNNFGASITCRQEIILQSVSTERKSLLSFRQMTTMNSVNCKSNNFVLLCNAVIKQTFCRNQRLISAATKERAPSDNRPVAEGVSIPTMCK